MFIYLIFIFIIYAIFVRKHKDLRKTEGKLWQPNFLRKICMKLSILSRMLRLLWLVVPLVHIICQVSHRDFCFYLLPQIRNSSTMLFSALVTRIFGIKKEKDEHSKKNRLVSCCYFISLISENIALPFSLIRWAWLAQLVRSLPSDHMVPGSIPGFARFEYLCNLLFRLNQLSFPSFRGR